MLSGQSNPGAILLINFLMINFLLINLLTDKFHGNIRYVPISDGQNLFFISWSKPFK